ncbi:MAG: hypothetical protein HY680_06460 [Chloroflexi bacterium]|nr:hypothetical protein [Chloroflexota bacterium]
MEEEAAGKLWQGERFQELMRARAFFIVCGTWEGAEMYDRYCAYRIAEASVNVGDSYDALVISDRAWSDNAQGYPEAPCIAVGGPVSNSMSAALAKRFRLGDRALGVLAADGRRIGYVWGNDVRDTLEAVDEFLAGTYLQKVLGVAN